MFDLFNIQLGWGTWGIFTFLVPHGWLVSKIPVRVEGGSGGLCALTMKMSSAQA